MKTIIRIILVISIALFLAGLANAQEVQLKLYDNLEEYAKDCNLHRVSTKNLRLYKFPPPYIKWVNSKGHNPEINKLYLCLENKSEVVLQRLGSYQGEFEYMVNTPDPNDESSYEKLIEDLSKYKVVGISISVNDEATYDREVSDPETFIKYFANE